MFTAFFCLIKIYLVGGHFGRIGYVSYFLCGVAVSFFISYWAVGSHDAVYFYIPHYIGISEREFEPGYEFLVWLLKNINFLSGEGFVLIGTFLFGLSFFYVGYRFLNTSRGRVFFLYGIFSSLSYLFLAIGLFRQFISMVIIVFALFGLFRSKDNFLSFLLLFCASLIHYSATVFLISWLSVKFGGRIVLYCLLFFAVVLMPFFEHIFLFLMNFVIENIAVDTLVGAANRWVYYGESNSDHSNFWIKFLISFLAYIFALILSGKKLERLSAVLDIVGYAFVFVAISSASPETALRLLFMVDVVIIFIWAKIFEQIPMDWRCAFAILLVFPLNMVYSIFAYQWVESFSTRVF
jgi:hypothetical protein